VRTIALVTISVTILLSLWIPKVVIAGGAEHQICDVGADYSLGIEDYLEAIRRHDDIVRKHPGDALAHYHLGFALGMMGERVAEAKEYMQAEALGLRSWDLSLNLGLAQLEGGDLDAATDSLRRAVLLGEDHFESHYNLALADERRGMLAEAEHETLASLRLNPEQPDARNLLGIVYALEGETESASLVWRELLRDLSDYQPARANLVILGNSSEVATGETAAVVLPRAAAVHAILDGPELRLTLSKAPPQFSER
jgi:Flp pilus assembly protein TadD